MDLVYGDLVRTRRALLGLSQRALAARSGVAQPLIAAIESGRRRATPETRAALEPELRLRPSDALGARRAQVLDVLERAGAGDPVVFGSVAAGTDTPESDLDLIVTLPAGSGIIDLLALEDELEQLLTVHVDLVSAGSSGLDRLEGPRRPVAA
ncbi:nucleotidyltransferase domain-containing protein [Luteimicrobium sp. DT211]|uniref:nucleotidyltransferase domain-containing protein n=1 Tax=Luteimicrobium sp. DT211 TaxID=3393412 RepID=UPI003CE73B86